MNKPLKFLVSAMVFLLLIGLAHAFPFDVKVTPIKDKIIVNDVAEYNITIANNLNTDEEFTVKKTGFPFWDMYTKPLQNPITLKVPANSFASLTLYVHPQYITSVDTYTLDVGIVLSRTSDEQKAPVTVAIISTEPLIGGYIPTVVASVSVSPEKIDPRQELTIKVVLSNQNVINYTNLTLKMDSDLFTDEVNFPLGPKEDKIVEVTKKLDSMTEPQMAKLVASILKDERIIVNPIVKEFEVEEYVVKEDIPKEDSFLKIKKGVKVSSNNPDYKGEIKIETSPFSNLFSSTHPKAQTLKQNGKYYLVWDVSLGSDRTVSFYLTENYRPIVVIIALAIAAIILYFVFRSPIVVRKSIANVGMSEGGISEAKVVVRVKNRSAKQISNIEVIDNAPHITHVEKELSIGSMQPHAVLQHPKKGIMLRWNIESLEAGDERVLSYRMKSRLSILGEFNLPAATARAKIGDKVIITNSNRVSVGG